MNNIEKYWYLCEDHPRKVAKFIINAYDQRQLQRILSILKLIMLCLHLITLMSEVTLSPMGRVSLLV